MSKHLKYIRMTLVALSLFLVGTLSAQTINGNVKDSNGEAVIGATVKEQGNATNGVVTDVDGNFTLTLKGTSKAVEISYIGAKSQVVSVAGKTSIDVTLEDESTTLNDVVVIGYGSVRRKDITGSVATVNSEQLAAVPVANAAEALTGMLPGVQITTTEGSPDAEVKIRVRGGGSITQSNDPLFIVDGFPVDDISNIPATEIEDITVLKDASSTAIYGSRGANGVILVTTKSGKSGKVNVSYNVYYTWAKMAKQMETLKPADYAKWQYELALLKNANDPTKIQSYTDYFGNWEDIDLYDGIEGNNWQDLTYGRTGHTFSHDLAVSGGSDAIRYSFTYAHMNNQAIQIGSNFKRDNFGLKLNTNPTKNTSLNFQARYSEVYVRGGGANETSSTYDSDHRLRYSVIYSPIPLANFDPSAGADDDALGNLYNPIQSTYDNDRKQLRKNLNLAGSFRWEVIKNLNLQTEFGYDDINNDDLRFWGTTTYYVNNVPSAANQGKPAARKTDTNRNRFRNTNTVHFDFSNVIKSENHHLDLLLGHEYIITKRNTEAKEAHGFPVDYDANTVWKLTGQVTPYEWDNNYSADDKLLSFFGRANYNFMDKYLFSATFRADASSKFNKNNRWGYFPSAALAWRVSSESWMEGTKGWLDDLKLRVSLGTAGNNNIPTGQLVQMYQSSTTSWVNNVTNYWAPSKTMANPNLKWETTLTRNVGLDFTLLKGKLSGTLEGYWNTTSDLLIQFPVPGTGYTDQYRNMGKTENTGFELSFVYHIINKPNWGIDFGGNIGFNKNKVISLGDMADFGWNTNWASTEIGNDYEVAVGQAIGNIMGYQNAGRYEVSDFSGYDEATDTWTLKEGIADATPLIGKIRPGSMKLVDQVVYEGDNRVGEGTIGAEDIVNIGNVNPLAFGGFNLSARAYGFDLTANFNYSIGNKVYNANKIEYTSTSKYQYRNMISIMEDGQRWTNLDPTTGLLSNDPNVLAQLNANTTMWSPYMSQFVLTDWAVEDASFLRLNTLSLGYTIPATITKRAGINSLRFYVTGYNLLTFTGYSGYDPEADTIRRTSLTPNVDFSGYPRSRQFVIGMNLNF